MRALTERVMEAEEELGGYPLIVVGGVARNRRLRALLTERATGRGLAGLLPGFPFVHRQRGHDRGRGGL